MYKSGSDVNRGEEAQRRQKGGGFLGTTLQHWDWKKSKRKTELSDPTYVNYDDHFNEVFSCFQNVIIE